MENIIEKKSFDFAVRIVNLCKYLRKSKKEYVISEQILKSGTSIGANIAEGQQAQSNADFISKMSIALKETTETKYWIRLLFATEYISEAQYTSIFNDSTELEKIITKILISSKRNAEIY